MLILLILDGLVLWSYIGIVAYHKFSVLKQIIERIDLLLGLGIKYEELSLTKFSIVFDRNEFGDLLFDFIELIINNFLFFSQEKVSDSLHPLIVFLHILELIEESNNALNRADINDILNVVFLSFSFDLQYLDDRVLYKLKLLLRHIFIMDFALQKGVYCEWQNVEIYLSVRYLGKRFYSFPVNKAKLIVCRLIMQLWNNSALRRVIDNVTTG